MYDEMRTWTACNLFILPLLGIERHKALANGLENVYIKDEVHGIDYENGVYILFRPLNIANFNEWLDNERARKANIIDEYDYRDGYTMLVYKYDKKWNKDVEKILEGKFSELSLQYQTFVPKTLKVMRMGVNKGERLTVQHEIIKKVPSLANYWYDKLGLELDFKEHEYWEYYPEREIFTQNTLNKLI